MSYTYAHCREIEVTLRALRLPRRLLHAREMTNLAALSKKRREKRARFSSRRPRASDFALEKHSVQIYPTADGFEKPREGFRIKKQRVFRFRFADFVPRFFPPPSLRRGFDAIASLSVHLAGPSQSPLPCRATIRSHGGLAARVTHISPVRAAAFDTYRVGTLLRRGLHKTGVRTGCALRARDVTRLAVRTCT